MNDRPNVARSFWGCVLALAPYIIAPFLGYLTIRYMLALSFSPIVAGITGVNILLLALFWMLTFKEKWSKK